MHFQDSVHDNYRRIYIKSIYQTQTVYSVFAWQASLLYSPDFTNAPIKRQNRSFYLKHIPLQESFSISFCISLFPIDSV